MNQIETLLQQTKNTYGYVNKLLAVIPPEEWEVMPDVVNTTVSWQAGHLLISFYFNTIMIVKGHQMDVLQQMPMKEYSNLYTRAGAAEAIGRVPVAQLQEHMAIMQQKSIAALEVLDEQELAGPPVPGIPHPVAHNIGEALEWNIQHTMWHCGQIGLLSRVLGRPYSFGLTY